jgi:hypothetical protein
MASYIEHQDRRLAALNDQDLLEGVGLFEQPEASAA